MPDQNDVPFNEYSIDFFSGLQLLFSGSGSGNGSLESAGGFSASYGNSIGDFLSGLVTAIESFWSVFIVFSWLVSIVLLFGIIYAYLRGQHYGKLQMDAIILQERLYQELSGDRAGNSRWDDVLEHSSSDNPRDWRLAIIEADIMLEEVLDAAGYAGTSVGEKLKSASPTVFTTLDQAWSAHLVRNKIAHAGSDFVLTKRIAQETITQFKMVFEEHGVI